LELALRFSKVDLNYKYVRSGEERNITVGLNWYLKRKDRIIMNYINIYVEDRADITISRFQINF